jgi:hypothetical protein
MKQTRPAIVPAILSALAFMLIVASLLLPGRLSAASTGQVVNVDYVIALLDAGVDQAKVIDRIEQKGLTFRLGPGDMARLRSAGADDKLIEAVVDHAAVLEGQGSPGTKAEQAQYQQQSGEDGQGIDEEPYGDSYGYSYPGYYSGYYDFYYGYPYPYYYYPYPYGAYFYPYYHFYPRQQFFGGFGRGGGGVRTAPRGGHWTAPHSGGGSHSAPRSSPRPSPRGSHH